MELRIAKSYLSQGIQIVSKAVPSKTTMSILECILIDASANNIRLIANDMEMGIETVVPGLILSRGIIAVDAQIFSRPARKQSSQFSARTEQISPIFPRLRRRMK